MADDAISCPFCGFTGDGEYAIQFHIEEHHTEDSPFVVNNAAPGSELKAPALPPRPRTVSPSSPSSRPPPDENPWLKCTRPDCGEYVAIADIQEHLDLHEAAAISEEEERKSTGRKTPQDANGSLRQPRENREAASNDYYDRTERRSPQNPTRPSDPPSLNNSPQKFQRPRRPSSNNSSHSSQFKTTILQYFSGDSTRGPPDRRDNRPGLPPRPQQRRVRPPLEPGRLGRRELGPHAFEETLPPDVRRRLINDAAPYPRNRLGWDGRLYKEMVVDNETSGLIQVLSDLCALDPSTKTTYLCHRSVKHVEKIKCDGNFCGFWNIQMVLSYVHDQDARRDGGTPKPIPNVIAIQNVIERAWDNGICSYGRIETGGVKNTRKWIGTHEALAFFTQIGVEVEALSFKTETQPSPHTSDSGSSSSSAPPAAPQHAVAQLLDHVEAYFISGVETAHRHLNCYTTTLPPIYFQRFGHSMTIVGLERNHDGTRNLLLFDPSFATSGPMHRLVANKKATSSLDAMLRPYRRSELGLTRWEEFEVIVPKAAVVQEPQASGK